MNAIAKFGIVVVSLAIVASGCAPRRGSGVITEESAINIARQAIVGKANLSKGGSVKVTREDSRYVVTFVHVNPPDTLGPDYDAEVTVDAQSGKVIELLVGS